MFIDELIQFCKEKSKNIKLKEEPQVFVEIAEKLEELKICNDLEEQGFILRLPCKVGDTVYFVDFDENEYDEAIVESIEFGRNGFLINSDCEIGTYLGAEYLFLTKEEAEQALKRMGE